MKILKFLILALISIICGNVFFDSSVLAVSFIFFGLNSIKVPQKEEDLLPKKPLTVLYGIVIGLCWVGAGLLFIGKFVVHIDGMIILGAMLVAATTSVMLVRVTYNLWECLKARRKQKYE